MTPEQIRQWADEVRNEREGDSAAETLDEVADDYETNLTRIAALEAALAASEAQVAGLVEALDGLVLVSEAMELSSVYEADYALAMANARNILSASPTPAQGATITDEGGLLIDGLKPAEWQRVRRSFTRDAMRVLDVSESLAAARRGIEWLQYGNPPFTGKEKRDFSADAALSPSPQEDTP